MDCFYVYAQLCEAAGHLKESIQGSDECSVEKGSGQVPVEQAGHLDAPALRCPVVYGSYCTTVQYCPPPVHRNFRNSSQNQIGSTLKYTLDLLVGRPSGL